jgi:hypothetical protein
MKKDKLIEKAYSFIQLKDPRYLVIKQGNIDFGSELLADFVISLQSGLNALESTPDDKQEEKNEDELDLMQYVTNLLYAAPNIGPTMSKMQYDDWVDEQTSVLKEYYNQFASQRKLTAEEITRLQQKYDENGYDYPSSIKLQRIEQHIDTAFKMWADGSLNAR